jgi:hypothetical protein
MLAADAVQRDLAAHREALAGEDAVDVDAGNTGIAGFERWEKIWMNDL